MGIEICPKEQCFLILMTKLGLKSICPLEDKQEKQYAVVGNARVRKTSTELSSTSKVACRKSTKDIPESEDNDVESSPVCLLEKCIYGLRIAKRMLLSTLELSFLKTTGTEICPKEPFFLV